MAAPLFSMATTSSHVFACVALMFFLVANFCQLAEARCHSTSEWKARTIYQVVTDRFSTDDGTGKSSKCVTDDEKLYSGLECRYCGGTFKGLQNKLDYILGMGFDAIWISPFFTNVKDGYHGYWPQNIYEVNPYFSSTRTVAAATKELKELIAAAHNKSMLVMLDIVPNHMGGDSITADPPAFDTFHPFNKAEYFHACNGGNLCDQGCTIRGGDYNIVNCNEVGRTGVEQCRETHGLIDLNDGHQFVTSNYTYWIKWVEEEFDFDGWRADSAKHMPISFWQALKGASKCYTVGEAYSGDSCFVGSYQRGGAMDGLLSYPLYYTLNNVFAFRGCTNPDCSSMRALGSRFNDYKGAFSDPDALGTFLDNHDQDRFFQYVPYGDEQLARSALVYVLFSQGIPIMYYGTEQSYAGTNDKSKNRAPLWWSNFNTSRPLYNFLAQVIGVRKAYRVWQYPQKESWTANDLYAFTRGPVLVALTNQKTTTFVTLPRTSHNYHPGQVVCNIFWAQDCQTVRQDGSLEVHLLNGEQKIFVPSTSHHFLV